MMKKLYFIAFMFLLMPFIHAQEKPILTEQQAIEIAKQKCAEDGVSDAWLNGRITTYFDEEKKIWLVSFERIFYNDKGEIIDSASYGEDVNAFIYADERVKCRGGE